MTTQEKKEELKEAILKVQEAQEIILDLLQGSNAKRRFEAFGKFGFDQLLANGNPNDESLFDLIEEL